jgi:hypothetical protein
MAPPRRAARRRKDRDEMSTTTIDLQRFCKDHVDLKGNTYREPFTFEGWMYATDGRICIRVRSDDRNSRGKFPPAQSLFVRAMDDARMKQWPEAKYTKHGEWPCVVCDSVGKLMAKCPHCQANTIAHDCPSCGGDGIARITRVGNRLVCVKYDEMIRELPGVEYFADGKDFKPPLLFRFEGGEGAIMGRAK